jgi:site-specific recombinase XerD
MSDEIILSGDKSEHLPEATKTSINLVETADLWANATTSTDTPRRHDLIRDKTNALLQFFAWIGKPPVAIRPEDVRAWQAHLEAKGRAAATIYALISRISSFYEWAMQEPTLHHAIHTNPVRLARPKAPQPYQSEQTKALSDEEVQALLDAIRARFRHKDPMIRIVARRDYALLLLYLLSGRRRAEIIRLRWRDVQLRPSGELIIETRIKGGTFRTQEIADPSAQHALLAYLKESGRLATIQPDDPLWIAHDRAQVTEPGHRKHSHHPANAPRQPGQPLTSHRFVSMLQKYAKAAGLKRIHLHQTRHTYASMISEEAGSLREVQEALDHKNLATTQVYVQRVALKRDRYSHRIAERLGVQSHHYPTVVDEEDS